jgi:hypothetical protein
VTGADWNSYTSRRPFNSSGRIRRHAGRSLDGLKSENRRNSAEQAAGFQKPVAENEVVRQLLMLGCSPFWQFVDEEVAMTPEPIPASEEVLRRVQGEFLEMPGLRLTRAQAIRLWGLDAASCDALLATLVDQQFLFRTRDGAFMRVEHANPLKATAKATLKSRARVAAA